MTKFLLDFILILTSLYHLVAGIFVLGPKKWTQFFGKKTYRLDIPDLYEPRYEIVLRFLGVMAICLSNLLFLIYYEGSEILKVHVLILLGLLFIGRAILRIFLKQTLYDAYQLDFKRSLVNIIFNIIIGMTTLTVAYISYTSKT
jgi:hypothetical protein